MYLKYPLVFFSLLISIPLYPQQNPDLVNIKSSLEVYYGWQITQLSDSVLVMEKGGIIFDEMPVDAMGYKVFVLFRKENRSYKEYIRAFKKFYRKLKKTFGGELEDVFSPQMKDKLAPILPYQIPPIAIFEGYSVVIFDNLLNKEDYDVIEKKTYISWIFPIVLAATCNGGKLCFLHHYIQDAKKDTLFSYTDLRQINWGILKKINYPELFQE